MPHNFYHLLLKIKLNELGMWQVSVIGEVCTGFWWGGPREGDHCEDLGIYGKIILKWIFSKWVGSHGLDCCGLRKGDVTGARGGGNESSVSTKCGGFF
jgi:hypothetical protein